jgi:hypothetical protein
VGVNNELEQHTMNNLPRGFVDYVLTDRACRPFLITKAWNKDMINGILFIDGTNDYRNIPSHLMPNDPRDWPYQTLLTLWKTSVNFSGNNEPNTWHYPENV